MAPGHSLVGMVSIGGTGWMLLFAAGAGLLAIVVGLAVGRRWGPLAGFVWCGLLWSVAVIAIVTLVPAQNGLGYIPADQHATSCSWDIGGPSPDGFWIFSGGQQLLNAMLFVPAGTNNRVLSTCWPPPKIQKPSGDGPPMSQLHEVACWSAGT